MRFLREIKPLDLIIPHDIYQTDVLQRNLQDMILPTIGFIFLLTQPTLLMITLGTLIILAIICELLQTCAHQSSLSRWLLDAANTFASCAYQLFKGALCLWVLFALPTILYRTGLNCYHAFSTKNREESTLDDTSLTHLEENEPSLEDELSLIEASYNGDIDTVCRLIDKGLDINASTSNGYTSLMCASQQGYLNIVQRLLATNHEPPLQIHARDCRHGYTAFMLAVRHGHDAIVTALFNHGACLDDRDNLGLTPLMYAARDHRLSILEFLLTQNVNINAIDSKGCTALMHAAETGHEEIVEFLCNHGADLNIRDDYGYNALMDAAEYQHPRIVHLLADKGTQIDVNDFQTCRALNSL